MLPAPAVPPFTPKLHGGRPGIEYGPGAPQSTDPRNREDDRNMPRLKKPEELTPPTPVIPKMSNTRPTDARQTDTRPMDTRPMDTRPFDTRATDTRPMDTRPVDTRPVDTRPAVRLVQ